MSETADPPCNPSAPAQTLNLPPGNEGLGWIASHRPVQLLLIPGVHAMTVIGAAAGDHDALDRLRTKAQQHAASRNLKPPLSLFCQAAVPSLSLRLSRSYSGYSRCESSPRESKTPNEACLKSTFDRFEEHTVNMKKQAAEEKQLAALQWLRLICHKTRDVEWTLIEHAVRNDDLPLFRLMTSGCYAADVDSWVIMHKGGNSKCLKWFIQHDRPGVWCDNHVNLTVMTGNLENFKLLQKHSRISPGSWDAQLLCFAIETGNTAFPQYIRTQRPSMPLTQKYMCRAAYRRDLPMIQWLRAQDPPCPWPENGMAQEMLLWGNDRASEAASIIQWAAVEGCHLVDRDVEWAAQAGELDLLKTLQGCTSDFHWANTAEKAAREGHIAVLEWLRDEGIPCNWSSKVPAAAAAKGSLDVLQWLRSRDPPCPWDHDTAAQAAAYGHIHVLEWLLAEGCEVKASSMYRGAVKAGHLHVLKLLNSHGIKPVKPLNNNTGCYSSDAWDPIQHPILLYLGDIGCPLASWYHEQLDRARNSYCTFHGLLRWCRKAIADPSSAHLAFDCLAEDDTGQFMLIRLSLLPPELITKIAVMAEIQHDEELCFDPALPHPVGEAVDIATDSDDGSDF